MLSQELPASHMPQDGELIWQGRPHQGWFVRPVDVPNFIGTGLLLAWMIYQGFWQDFAWPIAAVFACTVLYLLVGRFAHDASLRRHISYELTIEELRIVTMPNRRIVRTIAAEQLAEVEPAWAGYTASILLPQRPKDVAAELFDGWDQLVPLANASRRLELIDDAVAVSTLIRRNALAAQNRRQA